jgi:hypothetical protein
MSTHGTAGSTPQYYKNQNVIADRLFLHTYEAASPQLKDELLIGMVQGATDGNDNAYDAGKRIGNNVAPHLMTVSGGDELAINAIDYSPNNIRPKKLQMRFVSGKNGEIYFIELHDSLLTNSYNIELEDLKLRRKHDLNASPYKFVHDQNAEYRFIVHISPITTIDQGVSHAPVGTAFGYGINGGSLVLKMDPPATAVKGALLDLTGKRVAELEYPAGVDQYDVNVSNLSSGLYLLRLETTNGQEEVHKILLP